MFKDGKKPWLNMAPQSNLFMVDGELPPKLG